MRKERALSSSTSMMKVWRKMFGKKTRLKIYKQVWHRWADDCDEIYVDLHGSYVSDQFKVMAQEGAIKLKITASDSHWQLGRTDIHGRLVKDMLDSIEEEIGIEDCSSADESR